MPFPPDPTDPAVLLPALNSSNPIAASNAAAAAAMAIETPTNQIDVMFYTNLYKQAGPCGNYKELNVTFNRNAIGTATIVLSQTDPLVPIVMNCYQAVVPVTIQKGYLRWTGRVDYVDYEFKADGKGGEYNVTVYCKSDYEWFDKVLCWPNALLPIQVQFPQRSLYIGPAITCIKTLIAEQCFRIQSGLYEFINNALSFDFDIESWFGTLLESDGNLVQMLMTPIVVVPTDPIFDASPWTSINGRMDKISTLVEEVVKDNGLVLTADLWLPGDPQPSGLLIPLTAPTIVVDCKDRSGVTGPTGTFIDGLITDVVDLQSSALGDELAPFLNPGNEYAPEGVDIAPVLGVNFVPPWAIFTDHPRSGLTEFHITPHSPLAYTIIGGGKSPQWVNDLINATLEFLIDAIEITVGFTGIPDTILDGTFDDTILAFQQIENFQRRVKLGPYGYPEYFSQTGASAYTLDEWFALLSAMWDSRGYHGIILSFNDGYPYTMGKDLFIGGLASFAALGNLYTDYVESITIRDDRNTRARVEVMIGDGKSHEAPSVRLARKITKFEEAFQIVTLSTQ